MSRLFWQAMLSLIRYDILVVRGDFSALHRRVRAWPITQRPASEDTLKSVCHAVNLACMWYPRRALCLQRSAVTTCLLRDQGIAAQLVIGAVKLPFSAHAWVEVEGRVVNDKPEVRTKYGVLERV